MLFVDLYDPYNGTSLIPLLLLSLPWSSCVAVLQVTISQLKAELEKGPQEAAVYTQQIHQLQSSVNTLQQQSQVTPVPQNTTHNPPLIYIQYYTL